jgi:hypothetical protein
MSETRKDGATKTRMSETGKDSATKVRISETRKDDTQEWRKKQAWTAAASGGMPPQGWPEKVLLGTEPAELNAIQTLVHRQLPK